MDGRGGTPEGGGGEDEGDAVEADDEVEKGIPGEVAFGYHGGADERANRGAEAVLDSVSLRTFNPKNV